MLLNAIRMSAARQLMFSTKGAPLITRALQPSRQINLVATAAKPTAELGHDERNMQIGRPMSPHLTIYAPQITSMLSISHRMTGVALGGTFLLFGLAAATCPLTGMQYVESLHSLGLGSTTMFCVKYILAYPFAYHACNGVRHLIWDSGKFLTIKGVYTGGYIMVACATVVAIGLAAIGQ